MCQKCTHATVHVTSEANKRRIIANHRYRSTLGLKTPRKTITSKKTRQGTKKLHSNQEGGLFSKPAASNKVVHVRRRSSATFTTYQQVAVTVPGRHWSKTVLTESIACFSHDQAKLSSLPAGNVWISLSNAMCRPCRRSLKWLRYM